MRKWTRSAGLLFLALSSVYFDQAIVAGQETSAKPAGEINYNTLVASDAASGGPSAASNSSVTSGNSADAASGGPSASANSSIVSVPASDAKTAANTAPPKVTMNEGGTFSIQIGNDSNIVELLRQLGNQAQLSIIPSKEVRGTVPAMDLYNVTIREALDAILHSCAMGWKQQGNFIYVYTQRELAEIEKASRVTKTEVFHLYYATAVNVQGIIHPALSADGIAAISTPAGTGIDSSSTDAGGNAHAGDDILVVTDYPENIEKIRKIIKEIDCRPQQILVEATILQATLTDDNALGIDFTVMGGINFDTLLSNSTSVATALSGNILNNSSTTTGGTGGSSSGSSTIVHQGYSGVTSGNFDTQVPPGGLQVGVVHRNIGVFLQALESMTDTVVLANPKILSLDKQRGEVIVGRQDGYLTTTNTATSSTQTVQFLETGTRLIFRPYVGDDGFIRLEIHPEDSSGGLTSANLPFKVTTEVTSNVLVKDGNTVVIGGLFREDNQAGRSQVPYLGSIPFAGVLFRSQTDHIQRQEIIILLTPHIVKDESAYSKDSEDQLKEYEKLRVGVRKEMMPSGRVRLAEMHYEDALNELHKPHPDTKKALWNLSCATNLNAQFIEAIDLKEKLNGKMLIDADNSSIRWFVRRQIEAETAAKAATRPSVQLPPGVMQRLAEDEIARTAPKHPTAAAAPTTKPSDVAASAPATQPAVASKPAPKPVALQPAVEIRVIDSNDSAVAASPTTRPTPHEDTNAGVITAIPMELDDAHAARK